MDTKKIRSIIKVTLKKTTKLNFLKKSFALIITYL